MNNFQRVGMSSASKGGRSSEIDILGGGNPQISTEARLFQNERARSSTDFDYLRITGWKSEMMSVQKLLDHLARKTKSESSKRNYCWHLSRLCNRNKMKPNELVSLRKDRVSRLVQSYCDKLNEMSSRYANGGLYCLKSFFICNGYKNAKALDLERYHVLRRSKVTPEYIPTKPEVYLMADCANSLRDRAIILTLYSTGFRNSTLRALRYCDIQFELERGLCNLKVPVHLGMKEIIDSAVKGGVEYYSFTCDEATEAIRLYAEDRIARYGSIDPNEILFCSEYNQLSRNSRAWSIISSRELQYVVKDCARRAGIQMWQGVHPHSLRKAYESVLHSTTIDGSNLDVKTQEVFMGHLLPGSQDYYFDRDKIEEMRELYSKLKFGRVPVENKFKLLRSAVSKAFEGTGVDPDALMEEYVTRRKQKQLA